MTANEIQQAVNSEISLKNEIEQAINRASRESKSNTPDHTLAVFLMSCLQAYEVAVTQRDSLTN